MDEMTLQKKWNHMFYCYCRKIGIHMDALLTDL